MIERLISPEVLDPRGRRKSSSLLHLGAIASSAVVVLGYILVLVGNDILMNSPWTFISAVPLVLGFLTLRGIGRAGFPVVPVCVVSILVGSTSVSYHLNELILFSRYAEMRALLTLPPAYLRCAAAGHFFILLGLCGAVLVALGLLRVYGALCADEEPAFATLADAPAAPFHGQYPAAAASVDDAVARMKDVVEPTSRGLAGGGWDPAVAGTIVGWASVHAAFSTGAAAPAARRDAALEALGAIGSIFGSEAGSALSDDDVAQLGETAAGVVDAVFGPESQPVDGVCAPDACLGDLGDLAAAVWRLVADFKLSEADSKAFVAFVARLLADRAPAGTPSSVLSGKFAPWMAAIADTNAPTIHSDLRAQICNSALAAAF